MFFDSQPRSIAVGDFNNDNRMDIAVANSSTDNIWIFLLYNNGTSSEIIKYSTGLQSLPYSIAVDDFNNDNCLDIAVANYGANSVREFLGYCKGTFANLIILPTGPSRPLFISTSDFDNDNHLDIVVANHGTGSVGILLGYGNGAFAPQKTYSIDSNTRLQHVATGNLNKDNALDMATVASNNDRVHILPGNGNGTFAIITTYDGIYKSHPFVATIADFDNDNQSDTAVALYGTNKLLLLEGYFMKPSARQTNYPLTSRSKSTAVVINDFNNNNHLDIVINGYETSSVRIMTDYDNGIFARELSFSTGNGSIPQGICVSDLNNDNHMDIVTANYASHNVGVLLGQDNGVFAPVTTYSAGVGSFPCSVAVGDVNNDIQLDIVSANTGSDSIGIFFARGNGTFATVVTYSTCIRSSPYSVSVGNINNDKQLDIIVTIFHPASVVVFLGYGKEIFEKVATYSTGYRSFSLVY